VILHCLYDLNSLLRFKQRDQK